MDASAGCSCHLGTYPGRTVRRLHRWSRARAPDVSIAGDGSVSRTDPLLLPGHPGAVMGGFRHHLVSWHEAANLLHHGADHSACIYAPDPGRASRHVERSVRDDPGASSVTP